MLMNKVEICGVNTSKLPVLTAEEKAELFRRIKNGDEQARELYIKGNLRLVLSVIRRFQNSSENADDLFQIGCIGLIKAIDNFEAVIQHNESPLSTWIPDEYELNRTYGWDKAAFSPYLTALRQEMLEDTEKKIAAGLDGEPMEEY